MRTFKEAIELLTLRRLAVSTIAADDHESRRELQDQERVIWGIGPALRAGSVVAIYEPSGREKQRKGHIRLLFSAYRDTKPTPAADQHRSKHLVWLTNRFTLLNPLTIGDLTTDSVARVWPWPKSRFRNAGQREWALEQEEAEVLWRLILQKNARDTDRLVQNFLGLPPKLKRAQDFEYDFAFSYTHKDRAVVDRLSRTLRHRGAIIYDYRSEGAESLGKNLPKFLSEIYQSKTRFILPVVSPYFLANEWTKLEWALMVDRADFIIPISINDTQLPGAKLRKYIPWKRGNVGQIVSDLMALLRRTP